jgi:hypothetical protein
VDGGSGSGGNFKNDAYHRRVRVHTAKKKNYNFLAKMDLMLFMECIYVRQGECSGGGGGGGGGTSSGTVLVPMLCVALTMVKNDSTPTSDTSSFSLWLVGIVLLGINVFLERKLPPFVRFALAMNVLLSVFSQWSPLLSFVFIAPSCNCPVPHMHVVPLSWSLFVFIMWIVVLKLALLELHARVRSVQLSFTKAEASLLSDLLTLALSYVRHCALCSVVVGLITN